MLVKKVPINDIKQAKFNPKTRLNDIVGLIASIERVGLLVPISLNEKNELADGHRRLAACKKLGWTEVPVLVTKGETAELFAELNSTNKRLTGNEQLNVYLEEPNAVSGRVRQRMAEMEAICGRTLVQRMAKNNFTYGTYSTAKRVAEEAELESDDTLVVQILRWIMKYRNARTVQRALQLGTAPSKILAAVRNDKPIRATYV